MGLRSFAGAVVFCAASVAAALASTGISAGRELLRPSEPHIQTAPRHESEFGAISRIASRGSCAVTYPPQALATPDPLLNWHVSGSTITVSFIVGTDGLVHSPLILEGADDSEDRTVLEAVKSWRYRPALCNGVPMEAEGKIAFSSR